MEQADIVWDGDVGVQDLSEIVTKRKVFWIRLDNGQAAEVADVIMYINPFPRIGDSCFCSQNSRVLCAGIRSVREAKAFGDAVFAAGMWLGRVVAEASRIREE